MNDTTQNQDAPDGFINPVTGNIIETPADLVREWKEASKMEKIGKESADWCKSMLSSINVPMDEEIVDGIKLVRVERRNMGYDRTQLKSILDSDTLDTFLTVDRKLIEAYAKEQDKLLADGIKKCLVESAPPTVFFQLKAA